MDTLRPIDVVAQDGSSTEKGENDLGKMHLDDATADPALKATGGAMIEVSAEASARVLQKIDRHMLPLMCWIYLVQFANKSSLNYSSLMGIKEDAHLSGYQYSWLGSIFYAGYIFWEYVLRYLPSSFKSEVTN